MKKKKRKKKQQRYAVLFVVFSTRKKKGRNNSWQPKGLKRIEFYKYFGEKGAQDVREGH